MIGFSHKSAEKFYYLREIITDGNVGNTAKAEQAGAVFGAAKSLLGGGGLGDAMMAAKGGGKLGKKLSGGSTATLRLHDPEANNDFQVQIDCPKETFSMLQNFVIPE